MAFGFWRLAFGFWRLAFGLLLCRCCELDVNRNLDLVAYSYSAGLENLIPGEKGDWAHIMDMNYVTSPAVANGKLFVRMSDSVFCYDLTEVGNR